MSRSAEADVIVVGAGVIGMCTALELARKGLRVTVLERGLPGQECSWAGAGILAPLRPWHYPKQVWELCRESMALYPALAAELRELTGIDPELLHCGARLHDPADQERAIQWHTEQGLPCHVEAFREQKWLRMPWVSQIRNPRLLKALMSALNVRGVRIRDHCEVRHLLAVAGRVKGVAVRDVVSGTSKRYTAGDVVIAAGAWSSQLVQTGPVIEPVRGQMLLLRGGIAVPAGVWLLPHGYVVVRADGHFLVGATVECVGFDKGVTACAAQDLLRAVHPLNGALAGASCIRQWAGLRPRAEKAIPLCGPDAGICGLWWNTAHFRSGLAAAPAAGRRMACMLTEARKSKASLLK